MAVRTCPECGGKASDARSDCPHCGYVFEKTKRKKRKKPCGRLPISILSICPFLLLIIMTSIPFYYGDTLWDLSFQYGRTLPCGIISVLLMPAAIAFTVLAFVKKEREQLFITLSVLSTWLSGTISAIPIFICGYTSGIAPVIYHFAFGVSLLIWNLVQKDRVADEVEVPEQSDDSLSQTTAPTRESSPVTAESTSAARSQTAQASGNQKVQKNYVEDKPMTKKDAEGLLAYIWVRQYNTLPFDEALDKIMAYLIENKYVMTPETEAAYAASVPTAAGDAPAVNDKDLRHAREARDSESWEDARKYYERVRDAYPDLLEARFYYPLCKLMDTMNKDFLHVFSTEFAKQVLPLAKTVPQADISVEEQKELALAILRDLCRVIDRARDADKVMKDSQFGHVDYKLITQNMYELGIAFEAAYAGDAELLKEVSLVAFKAALSKIDKVKAYKNDHIDRYVEGIHRYEPDYKYPKLGLVINPFAFYATPKELLNK